MSRLNGSNEFPALSDHTFLRYLLFIVLYFAQGIPEGMTIFGIPAWMAMNGKTPAAIGSYVAIVVIPYSLKILAAPVMERFSYLPMGRRRPWLLLGQSGLMLSFIGMSMIHDPLNNMNLLTAAAVCVHIFILFQDIATDSLAIDIIPIDQQARANGFMWGAKMIGTSASLYMGSWLLEHYGYATALRTLSTAIGFIMLAPLLLRERTGEKLLPWMNGCISPVSALLKVDSFKKIFKSLNQVFFLPNGLLLVLSIFLVLTSFAFIRTSLPIFTIQTIGWNNIKYSQVYGSTNLGAGIIGMVTGGILIDKFGKLRMIQVYLLSAAVLTALLAFSKSLWQNQYFMPLYIALFNLLFILTAIGIFAIGMQFCWKRISAIQFTLYMAIYNLGNAAGAALIGRLRYFFDWEYTILAFPVIAILAILLVRNIHIENHLEQVKTLENNYLQNEKV